MPSSAKSNNSILQAMPRAEYDRLAGDLVEIKMVRGDILLNPEQFFEYVYFLDHGVVSCITLLEDGDTVEAATIGREGMVGLPAFLGGAASTNLYMVQVGDGGLRMVAADFQRHVDASPVFRRIVGRYANAYLGQVGQAVACNAVHNTNERCARWLLATHDRAAPGEEFDLTQDFMATMLGVHRPTVTLAMGTLQTAGLIHYRRGHVTIVSREGLEAASCECYAVNLRRNNAVFEGL
jgi:CRP-like cAMP-binding protein